MTREEAISILKQYIDYNNPDVPDFYTMEEAIEVVIKALKQEPCDDAISRQAVLDHIYGVNGLEGLELSNVFEKHYADFIKSLPPVTPQPKMGEWYLDDEWRCSVCNCVCEDWRGIPTYKYCPQCGSYVGKRQEVSK